LNFSNRFAEELYGANAIDSGKATMLGYLGLAIGDITIGFVSQYFQSRKKAILVFYGLTLLTCTLFFSSINHSDNSMYWICTLLGFSTGYWALFVTMGAEHFGTNLRATAATTIPNMVRGALPLINLLFKDVGIEKFRLGFIQSGILTGIVVLSLAIWANLRSEDTFQKELNYHEEN
ncbi:MAG: MFS transporter, partial [Chitinophagaceae bacterium]